MEKLVGGVVVRRDGLRVAVDHDRLVPRLAHGHGRVRAAIVELDALSNAVRSAAENHHSRTDRVTDCRSQ